MIEALLIMSACLNVILGLWFWFERWQNRILIDAAKSAFNGWRKAQELHTDDRNTFVNWQLRKQGRLN